MKDVEPGIRIVKLTEDLIPLADKFDCGDLELNEFLQEDAVKYLSGRLAVTYLLEVRGEVKAFFCLSDADIKVNEEDRRVFDELDKHLPNYPALLIGRLGVKKGEQGHGYGSAIIKHVLGKALLHGNEIGCRYLTVESLNDERNIRFYEKNGFKRLIDGKERKNAPMYLDLLNIRD
jgi:GNAT superfamily N-acetyltransferase